MPWLNNGQSNNKPNTHMKVIITASDGHDITTTKGKRNSDLLRYIIDNLPEDRALIREASAKISELRKEIYDIKKEIADATGYMIPRF